MFLITLIFPRESETSRGCGSRHVGGSRIFVSHLFYFLQPQYCKVYIVYSSWFVCRWQLKSLSVMINFHNEGFMLLTSILSITVIHCTQQELSARIGGSWTSLIFIAEFPESLLNWAKVCLKNCFQQIFSLSVQLSDNILPNSCNIYWKDKEFVYHTYLATPFLILKILNMVIMPM